jgi:hypothetical protein
LVAVPQSAEFGIFEVTSCPALTPGTALSVLELEVGVGPGIVALAKTLVTLGLAASFAASAGDIVATMAFRRVSEEMCVAPLARSDFRIDDCSLFIAALRAAE